METNPETPAAPAAAPPAPAPAPAPLSQLFAAPPAPVQSAPVNNAELAELRAMLEKQKKESESLAKQIQERDAQLVSTKEAAERERNELAFQASFNIALSKLPLTDSGGKYVRQIADQAIRDAAAERGFSLVNSGGEIVLRQTKYPDLPAAKDGKEIGFDEFAKSILEENKLLATARPGNNPSVLPGEPAGKKGHFEHRNFPPGTPGHALQQKINNLISTNHGT